uniref:fructose-bisphosphatase n=1 Tax=Palpitomonas bilix TaxID=652834 RepID=A0A7S3G439_9EUKA|mmetsp:Transcript_17457/g.43525  ORF Transcript_17457/g.43525 Transcript_17457/m.43525 type:complete len:392 (+) Transcript_17457:77-1252(+)
MRIGLALCRTALKSSSLPLRFSIRAASALESSRLFSSRSHIPSSSNLCQPLTSFAPARFNHYIVPDMETGVGKTTLIQHILNEYKHDKEHQADLVGLFNGIEYAVKVVADNVRRAGITNLYGVAGAMNESGDDQKKLDVIANEIFVSTLIASHKVDTMASEEDKEIIKVPEHYRGEYSVTFDPLDGSSNIDAGVSVGTIFGVYKGSDVLKTGDNLIAAGYALYSACTTIVLTTGKGVYGFTLTPSAGEFIMSHEKITIPNRRSIYSVNEGNAAQWYKGVKDYVESRKHPEDGKKAYSLRYIGSMVADIHRTLLYGGIFMYPGDKKNPNGKLRLLYECNPMAMIVEQAGGMASTGKGRVMEVQPTELHQRVPIFVGSKGEVEELLQYYNEEH